MTVGTFTRAVPDTHMRAVPGKKTPRIVHGLADAHADVCDDFVDVNRLFHAASSGPAASGHDHAVMVSFDPKCLRKLSRT